MQKKQRLFHQYDCLVKEFVPLFFNGVFNVVHIDTGADDNVVFRVALYV